MYLEIAAFYGLFLLLLYTFAEITKRYELGVIASLLLLILGIWILTTGIQIATGSILVETTGIL